MLVRRICGDVINLCLRSIVPSRKCSKKDCKTTCNHPTPEAYNSLQKVLEEKGKDKIEPVMKFNGKIETCEFTFIFIPIYSNK